MTFSASESYLCNICGKVCPRTAEPPGRETLGCTDCISTVRLRGLLALVSKELFGAYLALPDFPALKGLRGFGMSDPLPFAAQLEKTFDYTNTFYHQPPTIDIVNPDEREWGRYDFIISSEVMEHVPPPVERGFANLNRLLKPNGLLFLTVPYGINMQPKEHFPELNEYALASPGGKTVLVNRRRDGSLETFEDLCFHGGDGSTLELRVFTEEKLKEVILGAGFGEVHIASENVPEFGVDHAEAWSLPIVARKGKVQVPVTEIALAYRATLQQKRDLTQAYHDLEEDVGRRSAEHEKYAAEAERIMAERLEWGRQNERLAEERTAWAQSIDKDYQELQGHLEHTKAEAQARLAELENLKSSAWVRLGRKLGLM